MTARRRLMVHAIVALLIGGSLFDIAAGREHWPFSHYPMFARVQTTWTLTTWRPYGVTEDEETPLLDLAQIAPFDKSRLSIAFLQMLSDTQRMERALSDCWRRYDERRQRGDHNGPALNAIRLYRVTWRLDPWARNADRPDRMELLAEVTRTPG